MAKREICNVSFLLIELSFLCLLYKTQIDKSTGPLPRETTGSAIEMIIHGTAHSA